jgi:glutathione S-transferase
MPCVLGEVELYQIADCGLKQRERAESGRVYFDELLGKQAFVTGANFSMADINHFTGLLYVDFAKIVIPAEFTHLLAWRVRMQQRPSMAS